MTSVDISKRELGAPGTVLIVDDNPLIAAVLKSLLQNDGLLVQVATNGEEALSVLDREPVEVIVCDVMMPRMDGYELHQRVRQRSSCSHVPFIFLTALSEASEQERGLLSGADVYLTKPFDPAAMVPLVRGKILRARGLKENAEQERSEFRKKVVNTLSHEFRTPLVAITTGSELLLDHADSFDSAKVHQLVQAIQRGGARLERLVSDFMLLQQLELGVGRRIYETRGSLIDVQALVESVLAARFATLRTEGFTCFSNVELKGVSSFVYGPHLEDLLGRLLDNSTKFSRDTKEIEVGASVVDGQIYLVVADRGIGVDPVRANLSLELFGQVDREKLEQQGTGMGLALVQRYVTLLGGSFTIVPRPGGGTEARVEFPVRDRAAIVPS